MSVDKRDLDDYTVFACSDDPEEGYHQWDIGSVTLAEDAQFADMPKELEINGYTYHIEE